VLTSRLGARRAARSTDGAPSRVAQVLELVQELVASSPTTRES
jgi:hypothetical protein